MTSEAPRLMAVGHIFSGIAYLFLIVGAFLLLPYFIVGEDGFILCAFPMIISFLSGSITFLVAQVLFLLDKNISPEVRKRQLNGTYVNLVAFLVLLGIVALVFLIASMELFELEIADEIIIFGLISIPLIMGLGMLIQSAHLWEQAEKKKIKGNWKYNTVSLILSVLTFIFVGIFLVGAMSDPGRGLPLEGEDSFYRAFLGIYFMSLLMIFFISTCIHFSLSYNLSKGRIVVSDDEED